jgi:hypothetical protein
LPRIVLRPFQPLLAAARAWNPSNPYTRSTELSPFFSARTATQGIGDHS